jgi:histidinol-phosphate aminotransferase
MSSKKIQSLFRKNISKMSGYAPGEQPVIQNLLKLNTNENPYPPSPAVRDVLKNYDVESLRRYPNPVSQELREVAGKLYGLASENVIVGNGSDDILTIVMRSFAADGETVAALDPSYSLYPVLAELQGVTCKLISLTESFDLPDTILDEIKGCRVLFLTRPNAPTGNTFAMEKVEHICKNFAGIVLIDEAYVDFSADSCSHLVKKYHNVIVSKTLSKSYSLAGIRLGLALSNKEIIDGMMKVKDSYNVNGLTQAVAAAALRDQSYFKETVKKVCATRERLIAEFKKLGFTIVPSVTNFVFCSPPGKDGKRYFDALRKDGIIVRYFPHERTKAYVRITVGTEKELDRLIQFTQNYCEKL